MSTISPNMNLTISSIGIDSGLNWETNLNASLTIIDQHNHSTGQGVQIQPNGLNINADLPFNSNNATLLRTSRYAPQVSVLNLSTDIGCLYVVGNELYYNDVTGGHNIQITLNGNVNATSSGISSGTATAAFSSGTLVVKSSSVSGGNVEMQSAILTNSGNLTNTLTLQAPTLTGIVTETLPAVPATNPAFMTMDTSGNMLTTVSTVQGIIQSNLAPRATGSTVAAGGFATSSSCGSYQLTGSLTGAVTNLSITITTTGRPVLLMLQPDGTSNTAQVGFQPTSGLNPIPYLSFLRGGTALCRMGLNTETNTSAVGYMPVGCFQFYDAPSAGTYTYTVQATIGATAEIMQVVNTVLVAYEI